MSKSDTGRSKPKVRHYKWSPAEDMLLKKLILSKSVPNWTTIAKRFKNRNVRQCKDRWNYYLSPNVNNTEWTKEEDELLLEKYKEYGTKWSTIAKFFNNRTNTNVKNRYLAMMRKEEKNKMQQEMFIESIDENLTINDEYVDSSLISPSSSQSAFECSPEDVKEESWEGEVDKVWQFDIYADELSFDDDLFTNEPFNM